MPDYLYKAIGQNGQTVEGELAADSASAAIAALEARGLAVESVSMKSAAEQHAQRPLVPENSQLNSQSALDRQLEAVLQRREVLAQTLRELGGVMPTGSLRGQFQKLADSLSRARLASELRNNRLIMQWLPLLASGFTADTATERLSGLIAHASREALDRSQRRRLLAYPLLLVVITLGVFFGFSVLIVPGFSSMFDDFGVQVPGATRSVIFVSDQLRFHPLRCLVIAALCAIAVYTLARVWVHFALTTRLFGGYVAGNSASVSAMASLTSQLAELLSIDIPLPDALWIAGQNCPHYHFQHVAQRLARFAQESGRPLGESPDARYLPANVMLALQVGGGRPCAALLRELSAMYSDRVGGRSDWVAGGMAQLAIVLVGIAVAFLVIALLAPLFSLISGLT